jgi:Tfp pilus assembly protein FimV
MLIRSELLNRYELVCQSQVQKSADQQTQLNKLTTELKTHIEQLQNKDCELMAHKKEIQTLTEALNSTKQENQVHSVKLIVVHSISTAHNG